MFSTSGHYEKPSRSNGILELLFLVPQVQVFFVIHVYYKVLFHSKVELLAC